MIQWMHALSKSWVATLLMGGLTLSFLVWGIADVFTGSSTTAVASAIPRTSSWTRSAMR
jgi:hypothetical protein